MRAGDSVHYNRALLPVRHYGSDSRGAERNGAFCGAHGSVRDRYSWNENCVDLRIFPAAQIAAFPVYFLSGIMDHYNCHAGGMFLVCAKEVYQTAGSSAGAADLQNSLF